MASLDWATIALSAGGGVLLGIRLGINSKLSQRQWQWFAASLAVGALVNAYTRSKPSKQFLQSPRGTLLPTFDADETAGLSYPPDAFPGSRDVDSPYGSLRVYEWGPIDGEKVLLIHGISTPCIALGKNARSIAAQ